MDHYRPPDERDSLALVATDAFPLVTIPFLLLCSSSAVARKQKTRSREGLPPSHGRQSRLIVKVPDDRANEVAYPTKRTRERANERVGVFRRMSHCLLSLSLPIGKGRETARGGTTTECRVPPEECLPSISAAAAASSPFLDTSYSAARWLHSRSVCPISAKSSNFLVPSGDKQLELMSTVMSALQIILGGRDPTSSVRGTSFPHFLARH